MRSYRGAGTQLTDDHHTGTPTALEQVDDGRWHHRFGASWLKTTDLCLERARLEGHHLMPRVESDAANVGTAVHAVIETNLDLWVDGDALSWSDSIELFNHEFSTLMLDPDFQFIKYTERSARTFGERCTGAFYEHVLPTLPQQGRNETKFVLPFVEDDDRVIELSGAIDRIDEIIRDWKTNGSRKYEEWEYKRWGLQPTVYTWAALALGLVDFPVVNAGDVDGPIDGPIPFEYVVMSASGVQRFTVYRGKPEWDFLKAKCVRIAKLIEAELDEWPLQDNHALCSPRWCPAWSACKGKDGLVF